MVMGSDVTHLDIVFLAFLCVFSLSIVCICSFLLVSSYILDRRLPFFCVVYLVHPGVILEHFGCFSGGHAPEHNKKLRAEFES